jgi:hypothetical protein
VVVILAPSWPGVNQTSVVLGSPCAEARRWEDVGEAPNRLVRAIFEHEGVILLELTKSSAKGNSHLGRSLSAPHVRGGGVRLEQLNHGLEPDIKLVGSVSLVEGLLAWLSLALALRERSHAGLRSSSSTADERVGPGARVGEGPTRFLIGMDIVSAELERNGEVSEGRERGEGDGKGVKDCQGERTRTSPHRPRNPR